MRRAGLIVVVIAWAAGLLAFALNARVYGQSQSVVGITGMLGATDNALVRSDGTGGRRAQASTWILADAGLLTAGGNFAIGTHYVSGDGGNEGLSINGNGQVSTSGDLSAGANIFVGVDGVIGNVGSTMTIRTWTDMYLRPGGANSSVQRLYINDVLAGHVCANAGGGNFGIGSNFGATPPNKLSVLGDIASFNSTPTPDTNNFERARISWAANIARVGTEAGGTGVARTIVFQSGSGSSITATTNDLIMNAGGAGGNLILGGLGQTLWYLGNGGDGTFKAGTDNAYDIGASGANRPRTVYAGTSVSTPRLDFVAVGAQLTLDAGGAITVTKSYHRVDTFSDAVSDQLDTINGGTEGRTLILRADDSTHDVVIGDGTGNIQTSGAFTLDHVSDTITLLFDGTNWIEVARANNGSFVLPSEWQRFRAATLRPDVPYALAA